MHTPCRTESGSMYYLTVSPVMIQRFASKFRSCHLGLFLDGFPQEQILRQSAECSSLFGLLSRGAGWWSEARQKERKPVQGTGSSWEGCCCGYRAHSQGASRRLYRMCLKELGGWGVCSTIICHWLKATGLGRARGKPEGASDLYHLIRSYSVDFLSAELASSAIWLSWLFLILR